MKLKWTATISGERDIDEPEPYVIDHYSERELGEIYGVEVMLESDILDEHFWLED